MHASKVSDVSPFTKVADLANCPPPKLRVDCGPARVERPVNRRPQFVRPKLDQPRQRTLACSTRLRILRDLIIFGGARGSRDSGGRHPDDPTRYRPRSREASRRHCEREQAQRKYGSLDSPQEAESFCALSAAIFFGPAVAPAQ
jgi:hypothetical protein